jgi:hypothetical protein
VPKASKDLGKNVATNCPSYPVEESQSRKKTGTLSAEPRRKNHPRKQGSDLTWKGFFNTVTVKNMVQPTRKSLATHGMQISFPTATMAWDVYLMVVSKTLAS